MNEISELVFVYGTLKEGHGNHQLLADRPGAQKIGTGTTGKAFGFVNYAIPFTIQGGPREMRGFVQGELYAVTSATIMKDLDRLEGHPRFYERKMTPIRLDNGDEVEAWLYFYPEDRISESEYETPNGENVHVY